MVKCDVTHCISLCVMIRLILLQEAGAVTRTRPTDTGASDVVDSAGGECPVSPRVVRDRQAYRMC